TVVHPGRTNRFAAPASQAMVEVLEVDAGSIDALLGQCVDQADAAAWRLAFLLVQSVGRAMRQAQAAQHALVGEPSQCGMGVLVVRPGSAGGHRRMIPVAGRATRGDSARILRIMRGPADAHTDGTTGSAPAIRSIRRRGWLCVLPRRGLPAIVRSLSFAKHIF